MLIQQHLLQKLGDKKVGAITDKIQPIGSTLSVEKIAAIKAKRLAKKRQTIKTDDDIEQTAVSHN